MKIEKKAAIATAGVPDEGQLALINRQAKSPLSAQDVYVFSLRLCDDRIDRDFERFSTEALGALAKLFVGKTGIADHDWQTEKQTARIFSAGVEYEDGAAYIKAWAYMLRGEKNAELIREIEAGIKKEVSVGCAMAKSICSVCGSDYGTCEHRKGQTYGKELCTAVLCEPLDAYEFSFVAVPAQKNAGVLKKLKKADEPDEPEGRFDRQKLGNFVRLALCLDCGLSEQTLLKMASALSAQELCGAEEILSKKAAKLFPPTCQLTAKKAESENNSAFLI